MKVFRITLLSLLCAVLAAASSTWPANADDDDSSEEAKIERKLGQTERRIENKLATAEADLTMYQQMSQVNNWLSQWCLWNNHWPEPIDQTNQAQVQLAELVPNNPYKWKQPQESRGASTDPTYQYNTQPMNTVPDAASGFEGDSPDPDTSWGALGPKRVQLQYDPSLTAQSVQEWETDPPDSWQAPPGTITGISNSQDLIVVWGAGADGKPIRVPGTNRTRLFISNIRMDPVGVGD
ncbi:MAG: hypothetical protein K2Z81_26740 [Cyanobacteria bacterium]|nr:hypothetical protein [Cyanobacteriota bacterium]